MNIITQKKENQKEAVISVKNTGEGIDSEILLKLLKFVLKSFKGTGLGLFIAKSIIEAHGGKIWAENNNNINTHREKRDIFYLILSIINRRLNVKVLDQ